MQELIKQEKFELEVLERLNSKKLLNSLVFCGGTMLRLCFELNRFSVDLDFWVVKNIDTARLFRQIKECLAQVYKITDCADKFNTLLFEFKSAQFPRSLKIEIRKETKKIRSEQAIAYSKYASGQVLLSVVSPQEMMQAKAEAFISRKEIRDVFDMEFLYKRGIELPQEPQLLQEILAGIEKLGKKDYTAKLGPLLEEKERKYYTEENFKILKMAIKKMSSS